MRKKKKFNEFINKTIEELKEEKRYSTAHIYQSALNAFCEFCGCKVVYFHQLNRSTLKEFETYLRNKQLSWNTVSTYMRTLRGAYNKAVDQRITAENSRLFNHVYTGVKNNISYLRAIMDTPDFVEGCYDTGFIAKNSEFLQQRITRTSEYSENIALIAAYIDYLMNLEENNSGMAADNRPISKWKEFGLHKGVLRI